MKRLLSIVCFFVGHPARWYIAPDRAYVVCKRCGRTLPLP